jgi:non-lysosomal glucosylceramidase
MNFSPSAGAFDLTRRRFLASTSLALSGLAFTRLPAVAGPFEASDFEKLVPRDKKLRPEWLASLTQRGQPEVYQGRELDYVGMPVGGIACGQLYLTGDGRLSYWDIFHPATTTDYDGKVWAGPKYAKPETGRFPIEQGFALRVRDGDSTRFIPLDRRGFTHITFRGEYPIGRVEYQTPDVPVQVSLEAYSPFIPLNVEDSSLPVTVLEFTVRNTGTGPINISLAGWLENAVCHGANTALPFRRRTQVRHAPGRTTLLGLSEPIPAGSEAPTRPEIVFADFEGTGFGDWKEEGTAFGGRPSRSSELPSRLAITGFAGSGLANTHNSQKGEESDEADRHTGKLTSPRFTIERRFILFRIGGGRHPGQTGLRLLVDGKIEAQATGENGLAMRRAWFDVRHLAGKSGAPRDHRHRNRRLGDTPPSTTSCSPTPCPPKNPIKCPDSDQSP